MRYANLAALLVAALLVGCGGEDDEKSSATRPATAASSRPVESVRIKDFLFAPASATVRSGQKIAVVNDDRAPHTLTDRPGSGRPRFDTGNLPGGETGSFVAPAPGTYEIYCELHPFMKGKVEVVG